MVYFFAVAARPRREVSQLLIIMQRVMIVAAVGAKLIGSLRYGNYGLRTTAGRALSFVCSTGLSRANIER